MNMRDIEFFEMSFVDSSRQKSNKTYPHLDVFSYSEDIIVNIDILDPGINFFYRIYFNMSLFC